MCRLWTGRRKWEGILGGWGNITKDPGMNTVSLWGFKGIKLFGL